jgi:hypothetical protein
MPLERIAPEKRLAIRILTATQLPKPAQTVPEAERAIDETVDFAEKVLAV